MSHHVNERLVEMSKIPTDNFEPKIRHITVYFFLGRCFTGKNTNNNDVLDVSSRLQTPRIGNLVKLNGGHSSCVSS